MMLRRLEITTRGLCMRVPQPMNAINFKVVLKSFVFGLTVLPAAYSSNVFAQTSTAFSERCIGDKCVCEPNIIAFPNHTVDGPVGRIPIVLEADNVESKGDKEVILEGDAFVAQGRQSISAGKITYSQETERASGEGDVTLRSVAGDLITADAIELDINTKVGSAKNAKFKLAERGVIEADTNAVAVQSRGSAKELSIEGEGFVRLKNVEYTTCVEGQDDYFIRARELEIDQATGLGRAKGATIVFKGIPIFYAPTFTFPINDERKSGFLFPSAGFDSESGAVFSAPWYWNIAPNLDATFTPRLYTDRGVQLGIEVRHITDNSETSFHGEFLPSDSEFNDEDRSVVTIQHDQDITDRLSASINFNDVSDQEYFTDFRNDIRLFSATFIPRTADLTYNANYWNASIGISEFELVDDSIDPANEPFERRPELTFQSNLPKFGLFQFDTSASATNFTSDVEEGGWRYLFNPSVEVPLENVWGFVTPRLELDYAGYSLDDDSDVDSRSVPVFSIDSGIHLEKRANFFGSSGVQTLEPRIFFVYAGDNDQEDVPLFDTQALNFNNFNNLFSISSFSGGDRAADNRQVTLALTSRVFDEDGVQRIKASIGQAYFLEDREVTADDETTDEDESTFTNKSDILAEATVDFGNNWELDTFIQYGTETSEINTLNITGEYRESEDKFISLGYLRSEVDSTIEQAIFQGEWPVSDHFNVFGAERFSLEDSESLQTQIGFEYDACCWRLRLSANRLRTTNSDDRNSILAEFELTGLGRIQSSSGL